MANGAFTVKVDPGLKLSAKAKKELASAIGSATAATLARIDLGGRLAFVPQIKWPGGIIFDSRKLGNVAGGVIIHGAPRRRGGVIIEGRKRG